MTVKLEMNKKMLGKTVEVHGDWQGIVEKVLDEETFLVKDLETYDMRHVNIFDVRSLT
tara:strand:+ start:793 stop:966 length:174 start_codon:yes stop_codon:yes gene_type:complete